MAARERPHVLGIDDGPFDKFERAPGPVTLVGVMMEGSDLVEGVAVTAFPIDGADLTSFLAEWVGGLRLRPSLQAVMLNGITMAGLCVVDIEALAERLDAPVIVVNRRPPLDRALCRALESAGLADRIPLVRRAPRAHALPDGLFAATAGVATQRVAPLVAATRSKSLLPEPLRLAHMIARAIVMGESRGRP